MELEDYKRLGLDQNTPIMHEVNGRSNMEIIDALEVPEDALYQPCVEAYPIEGVKEGSYEVVQHWSDSKVFAQTFRDIGLYKPAQTKSGDKLALMVFNDGLGYADPTGPVRAVRVLDNLIHSGEIPPMAAIFAMPGRREEEQEGGPPTDINRANMDQRSFEYDSLTPLFGKFLNTELIPFATDQLGVSITSDPLQRAICGISSGGICAFNTAWHFPDAFGLVMSHCGSFVNIRGGHNYPYLVRTTPRNPTKVFLTSGKKDADILLGNWPLANQQMAAALEFAGYDCRFDFGESGHSLHHGGALFAESLRWLWGD
ncbi:MAG: enterochelin esterase-like enzyme [Candidatus Azotimanducaceae bacterium]|jgi:enterochelin esterase-like enzyme